jgi:hypothetical protein
VRIQYIQGKDSEAGLEWPTLEQLSVEYDIPTSTVRARAARENWKDQRNEYATLLKQKTREKTIEKLADKASQFDVDAVNIARVMFSGAARRLHKDMKGENLSIADQERLLRICDTAHRMGRRALGFGNNTD